MNVEFLISTPAADVPFRSGCTFINQRITFPDEHYSTEKWYPACPALNETKSFIMCLRT